MGIENKVQWCNTLIVESRITNCDNVWVHIMSWYLKLNYEKLGRYVMYLSTPVFTQDKPIGYCLNNILWVHCPI